MALKQSFEKSGLFLFRYRGQIPLIIFVLGLPFIYFTYYTDYYLVFRNFFGKNITYYWIILTSIAILVSFIGMWIRAYTIGTTPSGTSGRNTKQQVAKKLNTKGIYSIVRHPLYLGNYLMWAGLLIFIGNVYLFIIISLLYWIYYERIMFAEECFLEKQFGQDFIDWSMHVPAFVPNIFKFQKNTIPFSFKAVLRREYAGFLAITLSFVIIDYLRYFGIHAIESEKPIIWVRPSLYCLLATTCIVLILRTLKHHTTFLNAKGNRD